MTCTIVDAGAIDWCGTHNKPLDKELKDGTPVCRMYRPPADKPSPLGYVPKQFYRLDQEE